jgi:hypothetical protein
MEMYIKKIILFGLLPLLAPVVFSQERITIPGIHGELKFEGVVDDACWQGIA